MTERVNSTVDVESELVGIDEDEHSVEQRTVHQQQQQPGDDDDDVIALDADETDDTVNNGMPLIDVFFVGAHILRSVGRSWPSSQTTLGVVKADKLSLYVVLSISRHKRRISLRFSTNFRFRKLVWQPV